MKRFTLIIGILAVTFDLSIAGYMAYLAFAPIQALVVYGDNLILNPNKTVVAGQAVIYRGSYCKYTTAQATVTRTLAGSVSYPLTPSTNNIPAGNCPAKFISRNTIIPVGVQPGKYRLQLQATYQVNPMRSVSVSSQTEEFTVVSHAPGSSTTSSSVETTTTTTTNTTDTPAASTQPYGTNPVTNEPAQVTPSPSPGFFQGLLERILSIL